MYVHLTGARYILTDVDVQRSNQVGRSRRRATDYNVLSTTSRVDLYVSDEKTNSKPNSSIELTRTL